MVLLLVLACTSKEPVDTVASPDTPGTTVDTATASGPSVLLVVVDTLRADHTTVYGYDKPTTERFEQWATGAAVFERYVTSSFWTVPSMASLFTSTHPQTHGCCEIAGAEGDQGTLSDALPRLPSAFEAAGYDTAAFYKSGIYETVEGLSTGFELYEAAADNVSDQGESGGELTDEALAWLDERGGDAPFFLTLHYTDPHTEYRAPQAYVDAWIYGIASEVGGTEEFLYQLDAGGEFDDDDVAKVIALYDAEIDYWDDCFGALIDGLAERGLGDDTVVAVVSDHGEAFDEHDTWMHQTTYQEVVGGVFTLAGPGVEAARVQSLAGTVDVAPTLLTLAGVEVPSGFQGRDLGPALEGGELDTHRVIGGFNLIDYLVREDGKKLIRDIDATEVYDLEADPDELSDLSADPDLLQELTSELDAVLEAGEAVRTDLGLDG